MKVKMLLLFEAFFPSGLTWVRPLKIRSKMNVLSPSRRDLRSLFYPFEKLTA